RGTLECIGSGWCLHRMDEHRHVHRPGRGRVTDDEAPEQAAVDVGLDPAYVVVESPDPDGFLGDVEGIRPALSGLDLVAASAESGSDAKRPGTVRIDAVPYAVNVQAVAIKRVGVEDMNVQPLPRLGVKHGSRDPAVPGRLVDVRLHDLCAVGDQVVIVEV